MRLSDSNNEIQRYLQGRYIGPTEAFAHLFEYKMHEEDPTVTTLSLHLPGQQPVYYEENATRAEIQRAMSRTISTLMGYFKYNEENPNAPVKHLYQDFPANYVWNRKEWNLRLRGEAIGRIPYCNPTCGERYYLRLLLINIAGSQSFDDLRTVDGRLCSTFKQACIELHLIQDDQEWSHCFREASIFSSGKWYLSADTF